MRLALAVSVRDVVERADESGSVDPDVRERLRASGLTTATVPEEYGRPVPRRRFARHRDPRAAGPGERPPRLAVRHAGIGSYAIAVAGSDPCASDGFPPSACWTRSRRSR